MLSCFALAWIVAGCGKSDGGAADSRERGSVPSAGMERSPVTQPSIDSSGDQRPTIVFVGTSLTAGLGLTDPDEAYPALIQEKIDSLGLNYRVVNAGVSGETSAGALKSIGWLMRSPASLVVIETGANDGLRGLGVDAMRENIQGIIDTVRTKHPDAQIVLAGMEAPPNLGARYTSAFREVFPELARANHAVLIPFLLEGVAGVDSLNQADRIHPNRTGARVVAADVWEVLRPMLERGAEAAVE